MAANRSNTAGKAVKMTWMGKYEAMNEILFPPDSTSIVQAWYNSECSTHLAGLQLPITCPGTKRRLQAAAARTATTNHSQRVAAQQATSRRRLQLAKHLQSAKVWKTYHDCSLIDPLCFASIFSCRPVLHVLLTSSCTLN